MAQWDTIFVDPPDSLALSRVEGIWDPSIMGYYPGYALRGARPPLYYLAADKQWYIGFPNPEYDYTEKESFLYFTGNFIWTNKFFGAEAKLSWRLPDSTFSTDTLVKIGVRNWKQFPNGDQVYERMSFLSNKKWRKLKAKPQIVSMDSIIAFANKNLPAGWELPFDFYNFLLYPPQVEREKKMEYRSNPSIWITFRHIGDRPCDLYIFAIIANYKTGQMEFSNQGSSKCAE